MSLLRPWKRGASDALSSAKRPASADDSAQTISCVAALAREGRFADAQDLVNHALERTPYDSSLLFAKGSTLLDWGRLSEARSVYEEAERNGLRSVALYRHLGWACFRSSDHDSAERYLRVATHVGPGDFDAHFCLGAVLYERSASEEAATTFARALALRPNDLQTQIMLGNCYLKRDESRRAEECYRTATSIAPDDPAPWTNLGFALRLQDRLDEAISAFERAYRLEIDSDADVNAFFNLARGYAEAGRVDDACVLIESHLAERPSPFAHGNYGLLLLQRGDFADGWRQAEFRWFLNEKGFERPDYGKPVWSGQEVYGRTVLIRAEQGIGDTIQFLRYASLLKGRGARVILKASPLFEHFWKCVRGLDGIAPTNETQLDFDFYVHSLSLGGSFGTTLESIPASVPYIEADPARTSRWRERLGDCTFLSVGIAWAGNPEHKRDRYRSIPFELFEPLFRVPGVRFVSLQKGPAAAQLEASPAVDVVDLGPELNDLSDTAAVINQLDLVIGVDTAIVHLAGAMARPVWTLIPSLSDWRWLLDREDSPWYPTMRLFRQPAGDDWRSVIERVGTRLAELARAGKSASATAALFEVRPARVKHPACSATKFCGVSETRHGIIQYPPNPTSVASSLRLYGEYLQPQLDVLRAIVGARDTVIEIAAGCGAHTLALSRLCGNVLAYEADSVVRRVLRQNIEANKVRNVSVLPAMTSATQRRASPRPVRFAIDELGLAQLSLIKVNAGSLAEVVDGAERTLWQSRPAIFYALDNARDTSGVRETVARFGYRCWRVQTLLFNARNFNRRTENIFADQLAFALLAIPEEVNVQLPPDCNEIG